MRKSYFLNFLTLTGLTIFAMSCGQESDFAQETGGDMALVYKEATPETKTKKPVPKKKKKKKVKKSKSLTLKAKRNSDSFKDGSVKLPASARILIPSSLKWDSDWDLTRLDATLIFDSAVSCQYTLDENGLQFDFCTENYIAGEEIVVSQDILLTIHASDGPANASIKLQVSEWID